MVVEAALAFSGLVVFTSVVFTVCVVFFASALVGFALAPDTATHLPPL